MENTTISWTDHTFNPWRGCTKVSPGCAHCYAERLSLRNPAVLGQWGAGKPRVFASEAMWRQPLRWQRQAEAGGTRPRVFCASLADWLDDEVPAEWLANLLMLIHRTPNLDWLLLTKRPENWHFRLNQVGWILDDKPDSDQSANMLRSWLADWVYSKQPPANVWVGTTVEDQQRADERIPRLLEIPARIRFLSCEPLLGWVDLGFNGPMYREPEAPVFETIDWVICGGESGPKDQARPMDPDWAYALRDQCEVAQVPFFFKQWGRHRPSWEDDDDTLGGCKYQEFPKAAGSR